MTTGNRAAVLVEDIRVAHRVHPHRDALIVHDHVERRLLRLRPGHHGELLARTHPVIGSPRLCSTNAIESVNARIRKAVRARGHFPNEAVALKCIYMALMSLDPTGKGRKRWTMRWKALLNAFQIAFEGRLTPSNHSTTKISG